ncbi:MAG TPA: GspMb/PilO family protein [Armatimonadota bacterium]|jgi:Tfp pilus assembly protein PilO
MNRFPQRISSVPAIILLSAVVVVLLGILGYQYWSLTATRAQLDDQRQRKITEKQQTAAQAHRVSTQHALSQQMPLQRAIWSWSEQLPVMVKQVSGVVDKGGAKIDTLQPEPVVTRGQFARFPLRLTLRLSLGTLTQVLMNVRAAQPLLAIDHLNIRTGQTTADPLLVELTLSSYAMLENAKAKGAAQ